MCSYKAPLRESVLSAQIEPSWASQVSLTIFIIKCLMDFQSLTRMESQVNLHTVHKLSRAELHSKLSSCGLILCTRELVVILMHYQCKCWVSEISESNLVCSCWLVSTVPLGNICRPAMNCSRLIYSKICIIMFSKVSVRWGLLKTSWNCLNICFEFLS